MKYRRGRTTQTATNTAGRSPNEGSAGAGRGGRRVRGVAEPRDSGQVVHVAVPVRGPWPGQDAALCSASYRERRAGLAAFASVTIVAYLVIGPYFTLGWVTKGIELAIVMLVIADLLIGTDAGRASRRPPRSA